MDKDKAYKTISKLIKESLMFTEVSRTYFATETENGATKGLIVASEGLSLEEGILNLWLDGAHKVVREVLGEEHELAQMHSSSIKEELIRLLKVRNSL